MIIQIQQEASVAQLEQIKKNIKTIDYNYTEVKTQYGHYLIGIGSREFDIRQFGTLEGIRDIHKVSDVYKLVSSKWKLGPSSIQIDEQLAIGNSHFSIMAGPCSIESEAQIEATVDHLVANKISVMRGGVFKPRSSPYSFRGLGIEGLQLFYKACKAKGIRIVTEVMQVSQIEEMIDYVDIFQVGARNTQNFNLLDALGKTDKAVLLKRGISGTIDELLQSAEYIFSNGNEKIMLCERGIRSYEKAYRNTLDLNAVAMLKEKTHLPVIVDPSHGIGIRKYVGSMALASIMAGADGLIMEVHQEPEKAFSDGQQSLNFKEAEVLYQQIRQCLALRNKMN
jgi:3-deoxy-7-phosphoheptulonate synthase